MKDKKKELHQENEKQFRELEEQVKKQS